MGAERSSAPGIEPAAALPTHDTRQHRLGNDARASSPPLAGRGSSPRIAFVATNSITQGEQVAQLWPVLFHRLRLEIAFGHRTFIWPGRAAVHCVIVGLTRAGEEPAKKRLFSYIDGKGEPIETQEDALTAYLFAAKQADRHLVVKEVSRPINDAPDLIIGSKPVDGGYLIFSPNELAAAREENGCIMQFVRPYIGAEEFLNGGLRHILVVQNAAPIDVRNCGPTSERLGKVKKWRLGEIDRKPGTVGPKRAGASARALASEPGRFHVTVIPTNPYLVVPENGSEKREYVPAGWLAPPTVPSSLIRAATDATLWHFGLIVSRMHMAWLNDIGGKLKSDPRYSIGLVYNTFPWPNATPAQKGNIEQLAQAVLDARALPKNATSSLADLYSPEGLQGELRKAHRELDLAVDKLYRARPFGSDRERVEHLFPLYEALVQPTSAAAKANKRTLRRTARRPD